MPDLSDFGFVLPEKRARGPRQKTGVKVEIHRLSKGAFEIITAGRSRQTGQAWRRSSTITRADVRDMWDAILAVASTDTVAVKDALWSLMTRTGGAVALLRPEEIYVGVFKTGFWYPKFYLPLLALEHYYRVIEHDGRTRIRIRERPANLE